MAVDLAVTPPVIDCGARPSCQKNQQNRPHTSLAAVARTCEPRRHPRRRPRRRPQPPRAAAVAIARPPLHAPPPSSLLQSHATYLSTRRPPRRPRRRPPLYLSARRQPEVSAPSSPRLPRLASLASRRRALTGRSPPRARRSPAALAASLPSRPQPVRLNAAKSPLAAADAHGVGGSSGAPATTRRSSPLSCRGAHVVGVADEAADHEELWHRTVPPHQHAVEDDLARAAGARGRRVVVEDGNDAIVVLGR
nr:uncharacterized protein LOC127310133 [Lolium perenne]